MAEEYVVLETENKYGNVKLNKSVFSSITMNVIQEEEHIQLVEGSKPFKGGITTTIENNNLTISIPIKMDYKANVSDTCAKLQNKIFESISYMTDFKPSAIEIQVIGFIF